MTTLDRYTCLCMCLYMCVCSLCLFLDCIVIALVCWIKNLKHKIILNLYIFSEINKMLSQNMHKMCALNMNISLCYHVDKIHSCFKAHIFHVKPQWEAIKSTLVISKCNLTIMCVHFYLFLSFFLLLRDSILTCSSTMYHEVRDA